MNAQQKQIVREQILLALQSAAPVTLPTGTLQSGLRIVGFDLSEKEVEYELEYLQGKELVRMKRAALSRNIRRWGLTSAGIDYLEEKGLD